MRPVLCAAWLRLLVTLTAAAALGACSVSTTVSVTASTPAQVQHLYVTIEEVWLSTNADAAPSASGWVGRKLPTPLSVDLASLDAGALTDLISGVRASPGTYRQLRLVLADSSQSLTDAARAAGLTSNAQVQYLSSSGASATLPVELPSPGSQLIVPVDIVIEGAGAKPFLAGAMSTGSSFGTSGVFGSDPASTGSSAFFNNGSVAAGDVSASSGLGSNSLVSAGSTVGSDSGISASFGSIATSSPGDTFTGGNSSATTAVVSSTSTVTTARIGLDIEAVRELLLFDFDGATGALLNPVLKAYNQARTGGIAGTVDLSNVAAGVLTGSQGIVVSAEQLSSDGSRFEPVKSTTVLSSGAFTLYPLPVAQSGGTTYDVVIHGPGIRTMVISQVPVSVGDATTATSLQSTALALSTAGSFTVNTAANAALPPGGTRVGFFQTVPGFTAPHLVEYASVDPFSGGFPWNVALSSDAIDHGVYANGSTVSFTTSAPDEGLGTYRIGADSPLRAAGSLNNTISPPTLASGGVQPIFLPTPGTSLGGSNVNITGTLDLGAAGRFDRGFVLVSRGGRLVQTASLAASLSGLGSSATFAVNALPAGLANTRYDVAVRVWNSRDPAGTLRRAAAASGIDATAGGSLSVSITVP